MRRKIVFLLMFLSLTSCTGGDSSFNSDSKSSKSIVDLYLEKHILWNEIFSQSNEKYFAYVYSKTCKYCNMVKKPLTDFVNKIDTLFYLIIFNDDVPIGTNHKDTIGICDVKSLYIVGTPTLFIIENSMIVDCFCGTNEITTFIT